jgi:hypothetical protein
MEIDVAEHLGEVNGNGTISPQGDVMYVTDNLGNDPASEAGVGIRSPKGTTSLSSKDLLAHLG